MKIPVGPTLVVRHYRVFVFIEECLFYISRIVEAISSQEVGNFHSFLSC